jgi:hypothetical protein
MMSTTYQDAAASLARATEALKSETRVDGAVAAFGLAAAIAILFNTLLAWVKDSYHPLNTLMAQMTGHHWRTHGLLDVLLFMILGFFFMQRKISFDGTRLAMGIAASIIVAGAGLAGWFLFL